MIPKSDITALVLAGGASTRMGQDKALLDRHGIPLVAYVCQVAQTCCDRVLVLTPRVRDYQPWLPAGCECVEEILKTADPPGPLVAFAQGLAQVETEWVLLLACDLPALDGATLQKGVAQLSALSAQTIALVPRQAQGWEPLCGFYRRRCVVSLQVFLQRGGRSFQRWLGEELVQVWTGIDRHQLFNCNTPDDLRRFRDTNP